MKYRTDLRCEGCVAALKPLLDREPGVQSWSADVATLDKALTVVGDVTQDRLADILRQAGGYHLLGEITEPTTITATTEEASYYPLLLILGYLLAVTFIAEWSAGALDGMRAMRHFMAGFFLVFSFFKLLDVRNFAGMFGSYDLVAKAVPAYGFVYPFLELALGLAYLANLWPTATNVATLILMTVGTVGVLNTKLSGRKVQCACLGSVIKLPVATATLIEDGGMAVMALVMLLK